MVIRGVRLHAKSVSNWLPSGHNQTEHKCEKHGQLLKLPLSYQAGNLHCLGSSRTVLS